MGRISEWAQGRREQVARRRMETAERVARDAVQIREFHGVICLSYNDVPIVAAGDLAQDITAVLERSRKACAEYLAERKE